MDRKTPDCIRAALALPHIIVTYRWGGGRETTAHYYSAQAAREAMDVARWHGHEVANVKVDATA